MSFFSVLHWIQSKIMWQKLLHLCCTHCFSDTSFQKLRYRTIKATQVSHYSFGDTTWPSLSEPHFCQFIECHKCSDAAVVGDVSVVLMKPIFICRLSSTCSWSRSMFWHPLVQSAPRLQLSRALQRQLRLQSVYCSTWCGRHAWGGVNNHSHWGCQSTFMQATQNCETFLTVFLVSWSRHQSSVHLLEHRNINIQFHSIVTYLSLHIIYIFQSCCFIVFTMTLDYHYSQTSITVYLHRNIKSQHQRFQLQSTRAQR